jgi:protein TonB
MTLSYPAPSDKLFLLLGFTASLALHATLFFSRPSIATTQDFAVQPSDFSVEITMIETSAGQPETVHEPVLATPLPTSDTVDTAPTPSSLAPTLPTPDPSPRLLPTPTPSQLPPSPASSTVLARPNPSQNSAPIYPDVARKKGWEGSVILRAQITAQGHVESLTLLKSSGYEILDQSATSAVRHWRFHPQQINRQPTPSTVEIPVKFSLKR